LPKFFAASENFSGFAFELELRFLLSGGTESTTAVTGETGTVTVKF
jgi:hypothetical protein